MIYINIALILGFMMLAIISRENYSKYKTLKIKNNWAKIFYPQAEFLLKKKFLRNAGDRVKAAMRKIHAVSQKKQEEIANLFLIKLLAEFMMMLFVINVFSLGTAFLLNGNTVKKYDVLRDGYGGKEISYEIFIREEDASEVFLYEVEPREYTYEEFLAAAEKTFEDLEKAITAENPDMDNIKSDLYFPDTNEDGTLEITWKTDNSQIITADGIVKRDSEEDCLVNIGAYVSFEDYVVERTWTVRVLKSDYEMSGIEKAKKELENIEEKERTKESFLIPSDISGAEIELKTETVNDKICKVFILFVILAVVLSAIRVENLMNEGKKRDDILELQYFEFINRIVLLLGAGETMRGALRKIVNETCKEGGGKNQNILNDEIRILLNEIDSGVAEDKAYAKCGNRIGLPSYMKLMSLIGQNVNRGNSNLLELLEQEELNAVLKRKDFARKKGEEASGKLLLPMMLLMVVVMAIIMFPAISQFVGKI